MSYCKIENKKWISNIYTLSYIWTNLIIRITDLYGIIFEYGIIQI